MITIVKTQNMTAITAKKTQNDYIQTYARAFTMPDRVLHIVLPLVHARQHYEDQTLKLFPTAIEDMSRERAVRVAVRFQQELSRNIFKNAFRRHNKCVRMLAAYHYHLADAMTFPHIHAIVEVPRDYRLSQVKELTETFISTYPYCRRYKTHRPYVETIIESVEANIAYMSRFTTDDLIVEVLPNQTR